MNRYQLAFDRAVEPVNEKFEYRVWPDGTVQAVEDGEPHSWMSDDYQVVRARSEEEAARDR